MLFKTVIHILITLYLTVVALGSMVTQFCIVDELLTKLPSIRVGSSAAGMTRQKFIDRLTWLKELVRHSCIINWRDRPYFARISNALEVLQLEDSNGSIRKQPYCIVLTGYPGCGKSRYALELASACLRERYGKAYAGDIVTLNETDEFQSEFRSNHKVVIFDDLGAEAIKPTTANPWRKVIDFVNNIRKTSLNPNVEMKGNVYIEPDLVIITTNLSRTLSVNSFMAAPGAIYRRILKYVKVEDYENARLYRFVHSTRMNSRVFDNLELDISNLDNMELISRKDLIKEIVHDFQRHLAEQEKFVEETNRMLDQYESRTLFQAFYSDMILPNLPTKIPLDDGMTAMLPWYHRLWRKFCIDDKQFAVCQQGSNFSSKDLTRLSVQSGFEEELTQFEKSQVRFLKTFVDWAWYSCLPKLTGRILVYEDAICDEGQNIYSKKVLRDDKGRFVGGLPTTGEILELAFRKSDFYATDIQTEEESPFEEVPEVDKPQKTYIRTDYQLLPVQLIYQHSYAEHSNAFKCKKLKDVLDCCVRKLKEMIPERDHALEYIPSSIIQYQFIRRAWHAKMELIGCEVQYNGLCPDVLLKIDGVTVVIEIKSASSFKYQIYRYMREIASKEDKVIGIGFDNKHYAVYSIGEISDQTRIRAIHLCDAVVGFLAKHGPHFGMNHFRKSTRGMRCPSTWCK
jgi:hypothetical protein